MSHFPALANGAKKTKGASAVHAFAVTPHDTNALGFPTSGLFVGGAGNLVVTMISGSDVTFTGVLAGSLLPIEVSHVKATSTTATNIVALV
jgi:hypothetical protein